MFNKWSCWQYRDNANCWDFVRSFLVEEAGVPSEDVPKFGICPKDKRSMTKASTEVESQFVDSEPVQYAIACHYYGKVLYHVGVVDQGRIRHTGEKIGTMYESIKDFEARASVTKYKIHQSLCQN